jgi:3-isopropylmalate/(R)-2-methylmalate dehydratase small subunit
MEKITIVNSVAVPLNASNVDTDQIIPAVYLKRVTRTGFDDALFATWRKDASFFINNPIYAGAQILVAGPDFGTGSSREHAVWALRDWGFKVIISSRFADIFRGNSAKGGLLTALVSPEAAVTLINYLETNPGKELTVDLAARTISINETGENFTFEVDPEVANRLLNGLDDIDITLTKLPEIEAFEAKRPAYMPKTLPAKSLPEFEVISE